ncbi:hypothetical protein [Sphingomonas gilva]
MMRGQEESWMAEDAYDAAPEAPPAIGTDERRMHVRAYNYWVSLLRGRAYPSIEDLEPADLADFGPNSVLLDFTAGIENPGIAYLGGALRRECGLDASVDCIADVPSRSLLSRLTDHYLQIIANHAPIGFEAEFTGLRGYNTMYRGILMPFSSDDDTIDFIYGVINWKEMVTPEEQAQLDRAMADAVGSVPHASASLPVFADGPSALGSNEPPAPSLSAPAAFEAEEEIEAPATPDADASLADWLHVARETAAVANAADGRSRSALYEALGRAYDFALVADEHPEDYAELLEDVGLTAQARAPMTPVVKLVFGADYDKTRLTEFAAALTHGRREGVAMGGLARYVESYPGGLKGVVQAERSLRGGGKAQGGESDPAGALRDRDPIATLDVDVPGDAEFVVLVGRRNAEGGLDIVSVLPHQAALVDRALKVAVRNV